MTDSSDKLSDMIKAVQEELKDLVGGGASRDQVEEATRILDWFKELEGLKTCDASAIENACDALRRIIDDVELKTDKQTDNDKHYINRLNKLIGNLEEVVMLESKRKK